MQIVAEVIRFLYLCVVTCVAFYGLHNLVTTILYLRARKDKTQKSSKAGRPAALAARDHSTADL